MKLIIVAASTLIGAAIFSASAYAQVDQSARRDQIVRGARAEIARPDETAKTPDLADVSALGAPPSDTPRANALPQGVAGDSGAARRASRPAASAVGPR